MDRRVLRVLDANFNRAREGLRVVEDAVRFVAQDPRQTERLKTLRHELTAVVGPLLARCGAIDTRDAGSDVGTTISTASEWSRTGVDHVVLANASRVAEALRAIEEFAKTLDTSVSPLVEKLRYRFYDIERDLGRLFRPASRLTDCRLYVLITESLCNHSWQTVIREASLGGATCFQLREKSLEGGVLLDRAREFVKVCRELGVVSIINDRVDVAMLSGADGVHLGQGDLPVQAVRALAPSGFVIGKSTHTVEQAIEAQTQGADYVGIGPMFLSSTKPRDFVAGPKVAGDVARAVGIPTIAIGGITVDNAGEVFASGVTGIAVTQAVCGATDVRGAALALINANSTQESPILST